VIRDLESLIRHPIPQRKILHWKGIGYKTENNTRDVNKMTDLVISNSRLSYLPVSIGDLKQLERLTLINNRIDYIPDSFGNLKSLECLDLSRNSLTFLPSSIGNLNSLKELNLEYNKLNFLPFSLINLTNLEYLNLKYNPFDGENEDLSNKPIDAIFNYLIKKRKRILQSYFINRCKKRNKELMIGPKGLIFDLK
jgi:Leucine-rich repeat (LRR) protein